MITTVLFDLDGTLLPQDTSAFSEDYFKAISAWMAPHGYESKALVGGIIKGIEAMSANDGRVTNEAAFWSAFCGLFGEKARLDIPKFDEFYRSDKFGAMKKHCETLPIVAETVRRIKSLGAKLVVATNPVFPMIAQLRRIEWAGLDANDFELVTAYENSHYCKPNTAYYTEILGKIGARPEECMMIGNDALEDMCAHEIGIDVFLATDCLINRHNREISVYPHGGYSELNTYIDKKFGVR